MKFTHLLLSLGLLTTFATTTQTAHADVSDRTVTKRISRATALSHLNQQVATKSWHVTHLTKLQKKLNDNCTTYYLGNANQTNPDQRTTPWMGNHTLVQDSNHNITYYLSPNNDSRYNTAFQKAIDAWNNLGVIHLVPTNDYNQAAVVLATNQSISQTDPTATPISDEYIHPENGFVTWGGVTFMRNTNNDSHDVVLFNADADENNSANTNLLTAEHEIGHALGFDHDSYVQSTIEVEQSYHYNKHQHKFTEEIETVTVHNQLPIMSPGGDASGVSADSHIQLGQAEANALRQHYLN